MFCFLGRELFTSDLQMSS